MFEYEHDSDYEYDEDHDHHSPFEIDSSEQHSSSRQTQSKRTISATNRLDTTPQQKAQSLNGEIIKFYYPALICSYWIGI